MEEKQNKVRIIGKGLLTAYIITIILIVIYALLLAYTGIPESSIQVCISVIIMISIFIGSSISMKTLKEKGLINGAMVGIGYMIILYLLSSLLGTGFAINTYIITNILLGGFARNNRRNNRS